MAARKETAKKESALRDYRRKRDPRATNEPFGAEHKRSETSTRIGRFVVHLHDATRAHYDLRLEVGGTLMSFAVPKGPSADPNDKRLAVNTEHHPIEYLEFEDVIPAGKPYEFSYRMFWDGEPILGRDVARVINTRLGRNHHGEGYTVTVDFAAHDLLPANPRDVQVSLSDNRGTVKDGIIQRNPETGGLRLAFHFVPGDASSIEMRAQLSKDGQVISETWLYRWTA